MQTMLIAVGYSCGNAGADGSFGSNTFNALTAFQKDYNLSVDGIYGKNSKAKLEEVYNNLNQENANIKNENTGFQATSLKNLSETEVIKTVGPLFTVDQ